MDDGLLLQDGGGGTDGRQRGFERKTRCVHDTLPRQMMNGTQTLNVAYQALEEELPVGAARFLAWLRSSGARWVRIPLGLLLVACAFLWFLPVLGIELLPIGLLLLAQDLPWLRQPVGRFILFAVAQWRKLKRRFHASNQP